jgi:acyl-CoA thioester hydrolase
VGVADGSEHARRYVERCRVNFDDLDVFGMLHNGRFVPLIERGMAGCLARMGFPLGHEDMNVVVREIKLIFAEPIRRVGDVDLVFWVSQAGRSTATFEFVVKSDDGEHARGHRTITKFDPATSRSKPWSAEIRAAFEGEVCASDGPRAATLAEA